MSFLVKYVSMDPDQQTKASNLEETKRILGFYRRTSSQGITIYSSANVADPRPGAAGNR